MPKNDTPANRFSENAMKTFRNHAVSAFALAVLASALHAAPANAMGHSGTPASMEKPVPQASDRQGQADAGTQVQIDALRKELAELKAQMDLAKGTVATK
jgi:hypothetical protein